MYIPADAIDEKLVAVDVGYIGLSNDHYNRYLVTTTKETARLSRRERACGCQPCLGLQPGLDAQWHLKMLILRRVLPQRHQMLC